MTLEKNNPFEFVWDSSALHHPAKAGRIDLLGSYVEGPKERPWKHYITDVVADELDQYGLEVPVWAERVELDTVPLLTSYGSWSTVLATGAYGHGEASVAAWAEANEEVAIIDDDRAKDVLVKYGLEAHGSVWVLCRSIREGRLDVTSASTFFDESKAAGAWLPFPRFGFKGWALKKGLLRQEDVEESVLTVRCSAGPGARGTCR